MKEKRRTKPRRRLTEPVPPAQCVALIGDLVRSRTLGAQRPVVQRKLFALLDILNRKYQKAIISNFTVTTGDEFQGLLNRADVLPELVWEIEIRFLSPTRLGIGCGTLNTNLRKEAIGMDGPVWYSARDAINEARQGKKYGGVFRGFGEKDDVVLNGFARVLRLYRERLTERQLKIISLLKGGSNQVDIARKLRISKQAISNHLRASGWNSYQEAETGWKVLLENYDFSENW